jgi:hypothetical protein
MANKKIEKVDKPQKKKTGRKTAFDVTDELLIEACKNSHGIISVVAERLKIHRTTCKNYLDRCTEAMAVLDAERQVMLDFAESTIVKGMKNGDTTSARWLLSVKGKDRGYNEKLDVELSGKLSVVVNVTGE